jgi:hypothetical protein
MARTESKTFQCHPDDAQNRIDTMQKFHWSLLSSQDVKTATHGLESGGWLDDDNVYSVRRTEHFVKLTFSREIDLPNLNEIKKLEAAYFGLPSPYYPKLFPIHIGLWAVLTLFYGLGIVLWLLYFFLSFKPKTEEAKRVSESNAQERRRILSEVAKYD